MGQAATLLQCALQQGSSSSAATVRTVPTRAPALLRQDSRCNLDVTGLQLDANRAGPAQADPRPPILQAFFRLIQPRPIRMSAATSASASASATSAAAAAAMEQLPSESACKSLPPPAPSSEAVPPSSAPPEVAAIDGCGTRFQQAATRAVTAAACATRRLFSRE
jgi:hypothetical protein